MFFCLQSVGSATVWVLSCKLAVASASKALLVVGLWASRGGCLIIEYVHCVTEVVVGAQDAMFILQHGVICALAHADRCMS